MVEIGEKLLPKLIRRLLCFANDHVKILNLILYYIIIIISIIILGYKNVYL